MKKSQLNRYLVFLAAVLFVGCFPLEPDIGAPVAKMPLGQNGEVILYLQPLPPEADKLRFEIGDLSAVRDDGSMMPLSLSLTELQGTDIMGLQKLLASGILTPGHYSRISIRIKQAWVETRRQ